MVTYTHNFQQTHAILKLINGDELIAKVVEQNDDIVTIEKPAQVLRMMHPSGTPMIQCTNYLIFSEGNPVITINRNHIIYFTESVDKHVLKHYNDFVKAVSEDSWEHEIDVRKNYPDMAKVIERIDALRADYTEEEVREQIKKEVREGLRKKLIAANTTVH